MCRRPSTFTAWRSGNKIVYNCFSASCGASGVRQVGDTVEDVKARHGRSQGVTEPIQTFSLDLRRFRHDPAVAAYLRPFDISADGWTFDPVERRAVYLMTDTRGKVTDAIGRSLIGRQPKWKRYGDSSLPLVIHAGHDNIAIVEDVISAIKLSCIFNKLSVLCLLGTSLSLGGLSYLSSKNAFIALDRDATDKSIQMHRRLASVCHSVKIVRLTHDIKDSCSSEIEGVFAHAGVDTVALR